MIKEGSDGDDRYREASVRLRDQLGNDKVFKVADAWARNLCAQAERYSWPQRPHAAETLAVGKRAAKLADDLDSGQLAWGMDKVEQRSGVKSLDATKYLRALAEQYKDRWLTYPPLRMQFTSKDQNRPPRPPVALAIVLAHGFQQIPDVVKNNRETYIPKRKGAITSLTCLDAAIRFANAALGGRRLGATNLSALNQWRKNHRGRLGYWGFE